MSRNPYPLFTISPKDTPEQIEVRIGLLIRLYLTSRHSIISQAVVDHINALLAFSGFVNTIEERCLYLRLAAHWRCLAWIDRQADKDSEIKD